MNVPDHAVRCGALLLACLTPQFAQGAQPKVFGWIEEALFETGHVPLKVKLDTGALTSSMDAQDMQAFQRNGEKWVRFSVEFNNARTDEKYSQQFERPVIRNVKVRGAGGADHRPVVRMQICIGNQMLDEEFRLNNRSKMNYPVLIGRSTLERLGAVDVAQTFTHQPTCPRQAANY